MPCNCKVDYCAQCWDKALAKSFNACAKARCPTCRAPVRVDYVAETDSLAFSAEGEEEDVDKTRQRIGSQLRPVQVHMLRGFGSQHPLPAASPLPPTGTLAAASHQDVDSHVQSVVAPAQPEREVNEQVVKGEDKHEQAAIPSATDAAAVAIQRTAAAIAYARELAKEDIAPKCVCGSKLQLISIEERDRRFKLQAEAWRSSERLAMLYVQGVMRIVCDLCERRLETNPPVVWVCERGDNTIKHATSNDICARCFVYHVWDVADKG